MFSLALPELFCLSKRCPMLGTLRHSMLQAIGNSEDLSPLQGLSQVAEVCALFRDEFFRRVKVVGDLYAAHPRKHAPLHADVLILHEPCPSNVELRLQIFCRGTFEWSQDSDASKSFSISLLEGRHSCWHMWLNVFLSHGASKQHQLFLPPLQLFSFHPST